MPGYDIIPVYILYSLMLQIPPEIVGDAGSTDHISLVDSSGVLAVYHRKPLFHPKNRAPIQWIDPCHGRHCR